MPRKRKVWIDEDGDGVGDSFGEIVDNDVLHADADGDVVGDVVEDRLTGVKNDVADVAPLKRAAKKAVVKTVKKNKDADAERRRRRHMGF
jgi:hypothetical protein